MQKSWSIQEAVTNETGNERGQTPSTQDRRCIEVPVITETGRKLEFLSALIFKVNKSVCRVGVQLP